MSPAPRSISLHFHFKIARPMASNFDAIMAFQKELREHHERRGMPPTTTKEMVEAVGQRVTSLAKRYPPVVDAASASHAKGAMQDFVLRVCVVFGAALGERGRKECCGAIWRRSQNATQQETGVRPAAPSRC